MTVQGICKTVDEALHFYAVQRTFDGKGITNPSQTRYMWLASHSQGTSLCLRASPTASSLPRLGVASAVERHERMYPSEQQKPSAA